MYKYEFNKVGFILWDGVVMSLHNFYATLMGASMEGTNSLYCFTAVFDNLHGYGTKNGGIDDALVNDLIASVGAKFIKYPSVQKNGYYINVDRDINSPTYKIEVNV
tara:strand:+ start:285 stop:602 length:318 start_codon:yes stop_codon:yes gene_type:complete